MTPPAAPAFDASRPLSASQLATFRDCFRKWAWRYIAGIKEEPHYSAALGKRVHSILEGWLRHGTPPDPMETLTLETRRGPKDYYPGQIAEAGLHYLPPPGIPAVERHITLVSEASYWRGFKDFEHIEGPDGRPHQPHPLAAQLPGHVVVTGDHKTTSDYKWAKTEADLLEDPQAMIYAAEAMAGYGVDTVLLRWVYYRTKGRPDAMPVEVRVDRAHVSAQFDELDKTALEIHRLYVLQPNPLELPPSPDACEKYGGCPHKDRCALTGKERLLGIMVKESITEMMERKKREREAGGAPAPAAPAAPIQQAPAAPAAPQAPSAPAAPVSPPQGNGIARYFQPGDTIGAQPPDANMMAQLHAAGMTAEQTAGGWVVVSLTPAPAPEAHTAPHAHPSAPQAAPAAPQAPETPPAAPAAPSAPQAPPSGYWKPGDPMNVAQQYMHGGGAPMSVVAQAADNPPPPEVGATYDTPTESGKVNPPEAPPTANPTPRPETGGGDDDKPTRTKEQAEAELLGADLEAMDRNAMKDLAVDCGLVDSSCRDREKKLRKRLLEHRGTLAGQPAAPAPAPAPQAPPQAPSVPEAPQAPSAPQAAPEAPSVPEPGSTVLETPPAAPQAPSAPQAAPAGAPPILRHFRWEHLPAHLQAVSKPFGELAEVLAEYLPPGPETSVALRKLLESKDAAVRAALDMEP